MWFTMINESFICEHCWKTVEKHPQWSARNHCNFCLYSKHLDDIFPWDRQSKCGGSMQPTWIDHKKNKGYMIIHTCLKCNKKMFNKVSDDDAFIEFVKRYNQ
jgi:hypothetical protein